MRLCNQCKTSYPPGVSVCPRDGEATISVGEELFNKDDPFLGQFAGSYRLTRKLGEGGMGSVYLGEHPTLKKKVAVKILHAEYVQKKHIVERFFSEARAVSQIGHPNIVDVQDFGALEGAGNLPFILMEFLEGESLQDLLNREKKIAPKLAVNLILQLLDALGAAHQKGIVHRDLKPDNIFLLQRGGEYHVKLLDFGIAKLLDQSAQDEGRHLTQAGTVVGTPQYMSPEQAQGHVKEIDPRSDVYEVGVILFELLCGVLPFPESSFGDLVIAHVMKPPPSPRSLNPALSRALDQCIIKALQKKREDRYQNAQEMAGALKRAPIAGTGILLLEDVLQNPMGFAPRPNPTTLSGLTGELSNAPSKKPKLALIFLAGGGTALGILLALGLWGLSSFLQQEEEPAPPPIAAVLPRNTPPPLEETPASEPTSMPLPTPKPAPVTLTFLSEPKKARVSVQIDGGEPVALGEAPASLAVPEGAQVEVSFSKNGSQWRESLTALETRAVLGKLTSKEAPSWKKGGSSGHNKGNKGNKGNGNLGNNTVCPYDDC